MVLIYLKDSRPVLRAIQLWREAEAIIEIEQLQAGDWALILNDRVAKDFNITHCPICDQSLDKEGDRPVLFNNGVLHVACARGLI